MRGAGRAGVAAVGLDEQAIPLDDLAGRCVTEIGEKIIGPVFNHIANTFVESFVKRADQRYGKP